jgi:aldose sugar dehydrogenase
VPFVLTNNKMSRPFILILISVNTVSIDYAVNSVYGQTSFSGGQPIINVPNLKAEVVFQGLHNPTSMAFLGPNDILVLEKDQGTVQRITNGNMGAQPILSVNVATEGERGMLGIAITKHTAPNGNTFVFLYYTENNVAAHL